MLNNLVKTLDANFLKHGSSKFYKLTSVIHKYSNSDLKKLIPIEYCNHFFNKYNNEIEYKIKTKIENKIIRNKLYENKDYEIVLITWYPHSTSTIHNHSYNGCIYKLIEGNLVEESYDTTNIELINTQNLLKSDTSYIDDSICYHKIKNIDDNIAHSIHIYSPPNFSMIAF